MTRTFDPATWRLPIESVAADIHAGGRSLRDQAATRPAAFYLDANGTPVCTTVGAAATRYPALVTRIVAAQRVGDRATLHLDASLPMHTAVLDIAFPGNGLPGARPCDVTIVDRTGHRRIVHADLPPQVIVTGTIVLALRPAGFSGMSATPAAA